MKKLAWFSDGLKLSTYSLPGRLRAVWKSDYEEVKARETQAGEYEVIVPTFPQPCLVWGFNWLVHKVKAPRWSLWPLELLPHGGTSAIPWLKNVKCPSNSWERGVGGWAGLELTDAHLASVLNLQKSCSKIQFEINSRSFKDCMWTMIYQFHTNP